jgi:type VI secretion system secreted protein VgrG
MYTKKPEKLRFSSAETPYVDSETVMGWSQKYQCFTPKSEFVDYENSRQEPVTVNETSTTKVKPMQNQEAKRYGRGFANIGPAGMPSLKQVQAKDHARTALRSSEGEHLRINAQSNCVSLSAGSNFSLKESPPGGGNSFIITRITHTATAGIDTGTDYKNEFECIPGDTEIATQKPGNQAVYGNLTATVVQSDYDDASPERKYGMVKVCFPWDPDTVTPWLQVAQIFGSGGGDSGAWFLPQLDDDVLVSFLGGDTRRPVVVGIMHNGKDDGPTFTNGDGEFTRIGIRTPEGSELSFADKGGKKEVKEVYLESVGNFDRLVKENETVKVDKDNEIDITGDQKVDIKADQKVNVGQKITIEAGTSIELKVGTNKITIDSSGVKIEGMNVEAKATMEAKIEGLNVTATAKVNAKIDGAMSELSGKAMTTVKGAMVMIN